MSIQLFCGRPGSGKSYGVVENIILPALKLDRPIYTNIPLHLSAIVNDFPDNENHVTQFSNEEVTPEFLVSLPGAAIIIIDECWRYWAGGAKATDIPQLYKEFFSEHRHKTASIQVDGKPQNLSQEIILLTQTPNQLAKMVRELVDSTVLTTKMNAIGQENRYKVQMFSGCIPNLERPGEPQNSGIGLYKPDIYKYYVSHTKSPSGLPGVEMRPDKRGSVLNNWYIKYLIPLTIVFAIWGAIHIYNFFSGDNIKTDKPELLPSPPPSIPIEPIFNHHAIQHIEKSTEPMSKRYRITGTANIGGMLHIYAQDSETWRHIQIDPKNCDTTLNGAECKINGEKVTAYTGKIRELRKTQQQNMSEIVPTL